MKQRIVQIAANPFVTSSAVIVIGSFLANIGNFLFNFFMSRNLSVADYGTLASLVSLVVLASMPAGAVTPMLVKFAASYFANNELGKVKGLSFQVGKALLMAGLVLCLLFVLANPVLARFFNISDGGLIVITGIVVLFAFLGTLVLGLLQGKLLFTYIAGVNLLGSMLKLGIGASFVLLGFGLYGAMWGFALSFIIPLFVGIYPLRFIFHKKTAQIDMRIGELFAYGAPAALTLFSLTAFVSTDIMLVKHFFSPDDAGRYAVLSLIGRIIFFLTASISTVMFPMIVQKFAKQEKYSQIFFLSLFLVSMPSIIITGIYFLFPEFVIGIFNKNQAYLNLKEYLGIFGIFISMYSILYVITHFFLSINKTKVVIPVAIGAFLQLVGIWLFHANFYEVIYISLGIVGLLLLSLLIYYFHATEKRL